MQERPQNIQTEEEISHSPSEFISREQWEKMQFAKFNATGNQEQISLPIDKTAQSENLWLSQSDCKHQVEKQTSFEELKRNQAGIQEEKSSVDNKSSTSQFRQPHSALEELFEEQKYTPIPEESEDQERLGASKHQQKSDHPRPKSSFRTYVIGGQPLVKKQSPFSKEKNWVMGSGKTPRKLRIWSWNINGIRSKNAMKLLMHHTKPFDPDIICIIETKINYEAYKKDPIHFKGYNDYWCFCKCSAGYSGVAVLCKHPPLRVAQDLPQLEMSQEGRVLTLEFSEFYLVAVYVPASGDNLERLFFKVKQYEVMFHKYCNELKKSKRVIIAGDLNTARSQLDASISKTTHLGQAFTPLERQSFQNFLETGWVDTYRYFHPDTKTISWWNLRRYGQKAIECKKGKRLDYFLVDQPFIDAVCCSKVLSHITGRDHCPIQLNIDLKYYLQKESKRSVKLAKREQRVKKDQSTVDSVHPKN